MAIKIDQQKCDGCAACMDACNVGAIYLVDKKAYVDESLCTLCEKCIEVCPVQAIQFVTDVVVPQTPTAEVQSNRTSLWPTLKTAVVTLGGTLVPVLVSKIGDIIISALESKPDRSPLSNKKAQGSDSQNRRRFRGGK
jgi:MinD superfamily P-loop ATPase